MYASVLRDAKFFTFLGQIDADLAAETEQAGCSVCGGVLHSASYPRKPRGGPAELGAEHDRRHSFCCAEEGCRKRHTPPSVRFLGRKVYFGAIVLVETAMRHGLAGRRVAEIGRLFGVGRRTLERWRRWWQAIFTTSGTWRAGRGRLGSPTVEESRLPASLLERFVGDAVAKLVGALRFVAPLTTGSGF